MAAHIAAVTCAVLAALIAPWTLAEVRLKPDTTTNGLIAVASGQAGAAGARTASSPPTRPDESIIVNVPATAPWTDTGVVVRAGDRIDMRAWGRVVYRAVDEARFITPTGTGSAGGCNYVLVDSGVPANAVVANIAPELTFDGKGFLVGAARTVTVPAAGSSASEGRLFVGVNHQGIVCDRSGYDSWEFRNNSSGAFTVEIAIRRKK